MYISYNICKYELDSNTDKLKKKLNIIINAINVRNHQVKSNLYFFSLQKFDVISTGKNNNFLKS